MKFSKRMLVMLVAAVMLVAGSLSYFAFAADVEPYAAVARCGRCNETAEIVEVSRTGPYDDGYHKVGIRTCYITYYIVIEDYVCANGHHESAGVYREYWHSICK